MRTQIEKDALSLEAARTTLRQIDLDRLGSDEAALSKNEVQPFGRKPRLVNRNKAIDHLAFALPDTGHVDGPRAKPEPECRCMAYKVHHLRTLNDILAWQARNVGTRTPDQSPLDHRHALPRSRQVPSDVLAGLAATHDDILEMLEAGHR